METPAGVSEVAEDVQSPASGQDEGVSDNESAMAQYIDEDVPAFYDAMADEIAAYQAEEESEQTAGMNFLDEFMP